MASECQRPASDSAPAIAGLLLGVGLILGVVVATAGVVAVIVRFRRSVGAEHQQIKWFVGAATIEIAAIFVTTLGRAPAALRRSRCDRRRAVHPVAAAIAVLRYRLYEIDRIISRTIGYGVVTAALAVVFVGDVLGLQFVLAPFTGGDTVAVAASTLVVAALFQPLRARVQRVVDRRFDRARYDGQQLADAFAGRLRDEVDLERLRTALVGTVDEAVRPRVSSLWLRSVDSHE